MPETPTVFVVDDDPAFCDGLRTLLESVSLLAEFYASATEFLEHRVWERPGCCLLDVRLPGMSGLDLLDRLRSHELAPPAIVLTGFGDVPMAVRALKAGAVDFIEKPYESQVLLDSVQRALASDADARQRRAGRIDFCNRLQELTPREREILDLLVSGLMLKEAALRLKISVKTAQVHRARVLAKLGAESLAGLMRQTISYGYPDSPREFHVAGRTKA